MNRTCLLLSTILFLQACTFATPHINSPLENLQEQFPNLEIVTEETMPPLVEVTIPERVNTPDDQAYTLRVTVGQTVPFSGILFSDSAAAYVTTEYVALSERFQLALGTQRQMDFARLVLDTNSLRLQINGDRERFFVVLQNQQEQINDLRILNAEANSPWQKIWLGLGVGAAGILLGLLAGFFVGISN